MAEAPITAEEIEKARGDFWVYMAMAHETDMRERWEGKAVPAEHHARIIDALMDDSLEHTLVVTPRGSGKTTLIQGWIEWKLGQASLSGDKEWPNTFRVAYFSNTAPQAHRLSNAIRATIESNEFFHAIFPKVKKHKDKWGEGEWKVAGNNSKDSNFTASGVMGAIVGIRALYMIFDDICDGENMGSPTEKVKLLGTEDGTVPGWLDTTAKPILVPWGRMIMTCTRWAYWDGAAWAESQGWHKLFMKALEERTEDALNVQPGVELSRFVSYWPERFTVEWLLNEREKNARAFALAYQNEVSPEEGLVFQRDWFQDRFSEPPPEIGLRGDTWDTAAGVGPRRSYSVGLSAVVTPDYHVYVLNMLRGQLLYPDLLVAIEMVAQRNRSNFVLIEGKSSGKQAVQDMRLKHLPIIEFQPFGQPGSPTRGEANMRISAICAVGRVHLPSDYFCRKAGSTGWLADFEQELFSYEGKPPDDIVDALCQMLYWVEEQRLRSIQLGMRQRPPALWPTSVAIGPPRARV